MDREVIDALQQCLQQNTPVSLVTVIENRGSSPGKTGAMMVVRDDGRTWGTVGGGSLEHQVVQEALDCLAERRSRGAAYNLTAKESLAMTCGGDVRLFIRVFGSRPRLILVGGGHIGLELCRLAQNQGFSVVVLDDRAEYAAQDRFPGAVVRHTEDVANTLRDDPLDRDCFVAIASRSHQVDREALAAVVGSRAAYVGMIGSSGKIRTAFRALQQQGVPRQQIDAVYAPMGLNIGSVQPKEIALSIMCEIMLVKNGGSAEHLRAVKSIQY